jgi:tryptophanyl-tRNA synthetase
MQKFKRAVTDSETEVRYDPVAKPGVSNLLDILAAATAAKPTDLAAGYTQYGKLKSDAGEAVVALLEPIQKRYAELIDDRGELSRLLRVGSAKAGTVASKTLERAYSAIGLLPA